MRTPLLIPRRRFLRGLGTAIALPVFESLLPANLRAAAADPASPVAAKLYPLRLVFTHVPNGMADMDLWTPKTTGPDYEVTRILEPLKDFKKQLLIVSGLTQDNAARIKNGVDDSPNIRVGTVTGFYTRAHAAYLTGARPLRSQTLKLGISADQIAAKKIGAQTDLPSLQLSCDTHGLSGHCEDVYSCGYLYYLSWKDETTPVPPDVNPRLVFEQLFVTGAFPTETAEARAKRVQDNLSVLDFVIDDAKLLKASLGLADRAKLDAYLASIRDLEQRITKSSVRDYGMDSANRSGIATDQHANPNPNFEELVKLMFDLQVLALQGDRTRVITFSYGHDLSNRPYPQLGISEGTRDMAGIGPASVQSRNFALYSEKIAKINVYHTTLFAGFLQKLQAIPEGNHTLLDHCLVSYGSGMSSSFTKDVDNLPILVAGSGGGALKTGQHLAFDTRIKTPLNNLWLTLLDAVGAPTDKFGDSTGKLTEILA